MKPAHARRTLALLLVAAAGVALLLRPDSPAQSKRPDANFVAEVTAGWKKLVEADEALIAYAVDHQSGRKLPPDVKGKSFERDDHFRVKKRADAALVEGTRWLAADNPDYRFRLKRNASGGEWVVEKIGEVGQKSSLLQPLDDPHGGGVLYPTSCHFGSGPFMLEALGSGRITLSKLRDGPAGTVVAAFSLEIPNELADPKVFAKQAAELEKLPAKDRERARTKLNERAKFRIVHAGEITLDPELDYAVLASVTADPGDAESHNVFERKARRVKTRAGSAVRCDSVRLTNKTKSYGYVWDSWRYDNYGTEPTPPTEFYLSHYGFPEPLGVTPPPSPKRRWLYLGGAAVGLLLLSAVLRVVWKRRAAAKAA